MLGAAGLKKHLPAVTTARSRARETGSVVAAARQLFFAYKKKSFTVHTERTQAIARGGIRCLACGPKKAPTGGHDGSFESP